MASTSFAKIDQGLLGFSFLQLSIVRNFKVLTITAMPSSKGFFYIDFFGDTNPWLIIRAIWDIISSFSNLTYCPRSNLLTLHFFTHTFIHNYIYQPISTGTGEIKYLANSSNSSLFFLNERSNL